MTTSLLRGLSLAATLLGFAGIALVALRRWRAQQASSALLQNVLDNAPVGLGFLDDALHVRQMNRALALMSERGLGLSRWRGSVRRICRRSATRFAARLPGGGARRGASHRRVRHRGAGARQSAALAREYQVGFYPLRPAEAGGCGRGRRDWHNSVAGRLEATV